MTRYDWILVIVLVIVSGLLLGLRQAPVSVGQRLQAIVELEGKTVKVIDLKATNGNIVSLQLPRGEARLEVRQDQVRLLPMPLSICPRKICSHTGWIKRPGETIICVPNRLVIRLAGQGGELLDAVTK